MISLKQVKHEREPKEQAIPILDIDLYPNAVGKPDLNVS